LACFPGPLSPWDRGFLAKPSGRLLPAEALWPHHRRRQRH
jgi:hypothetical protein